MSARDFIPTMERVGASAFRTYRLTCGSCGVTANIGSQSFGERLACDLVPKKFGERGWVVGKRRRTTAALPVWPRANSEREP